jgi:hypothetical protein
MKEAIARDVEGHQLWLILAARNRDFGIRSDTTSNSHRVKFSGDGCI